MLWGGALSYSHSPYKGYTVWWMRANVDKRAPSTQWPCPSPRASGTSSHATTASAWRSGRGATASRTARTPLTRRTAGSWSPTPATISTWPRKQARGARWRYSLTLCSTLFQTLTQTLGNSRQSSPSLSDGLTTASSLTICDLLLMTICSSLTRRRASGFLFSSLKTQTKRRLEQT